MIHRRATAKRDLVEHFVYWPNTETLSSQIVSWRPLTRLAGTSLNTPKWAPRCNYVGPV